MQKGPMLHFKWRHFYLLRKNNLKNHFFKKSLKVAGIKCRDKLRLIFQRFGTCSTIMNNEFHKLGRLFMIMVQQVPKCRNIMSTYVNFQHLGN